MTATITSKGQITIPVEIRKQLGVKAGDRLDFVYDKGSVVLKTRKLPLEALRGIAKSRRRKPVTLAEMKRAIAEGAVGRYLRTTGGGRSSK